MNTQASQENGQLASLRSGPWLGRLFIMWLSLTAANFAYQAATVADWGTAIERTFFQGLALLCVAIARPHQP